MQNSVEKYPYNNRFLVYINWSFASLLIAISLILTAKNYLKSPELIWICISCIIWCFSMLIFSQILLALIHLKSPHYAIIIDDDSIIIPKNSLVPDSYYIQLDEIIYENEFIENGQNKYIIIYRDQSIVICRSLLQHTNDWPKIIYRIKSVFV